MMQWWLLTLPFQALYVFCIVCAVYSDIRYLKIPNWVTATLAVAFIPYCILLWPSPDLLARLGIAAVIFLISLVFYHFEWLGGGDVKLLTAVSLWIGPAHIAAFAILMAVLGALLALVLINLRRIGNIYGTIWYDRLPSNVRLWIEEGVCPYGIAIGIAALCIGPRIFA